jgi:hypothetical protein
MLALYVPCTNKFQPFSKQPKPVSQEGQCSLSPFLMETLRKSGTCPDENGRVLTNSIALCYNSIMPKRVSLTISDEAATILADRSRIPFLDQGKWVSEAIVMRASQDEADRQDTLRAKVRELEAELMQLKAEIEKR